MYSGGASRSSSLIKTAGAAWVGYQVEYDRISPKQETLSPAKKNCGELKEKLKEVENHLAIPDTT